jgi:hypothetical protein
MLYEAKKVEKTRIGECEATHLDGSGQDVKTTLHHNMWLCDACLESEREAERQSTEASKKLVDRSRDIDKNVVLSKDIYNAATVSFIELQGAVKNNAEVEESQKKAVLAQLCSERLDTYAAAIFETKARLAELENTRYAWQQNMQAVVSELQEKEQEKYRKYRVDYKPAPAPKAPRAKTPKTTTKELEETVVLAAKYKVPVALLRSIAVSQKVSNEEAAKQAAALMKVV